MLNNTNVRRTRYCRCVFFTQKSDTTFDSFQKSLDSRMKVSAEGICTYFKRKDPVLPEEEEILKTKGAW